MTDLIPSIAEALIEEQGLDIAIPDGYTYIPSDAIAGKQLTSIIIPDGVTRIGDWEFYGNQLTSVIIPDGVTKIGDMAFADNKLTEIRIPDSVTSIGPQAFADNNLTSIYIPEGLTTIEVGTFYGNQLTSAFIPDGVTIIYGSAFADNQLSNIDIPASVREIHYEAFRGNQLKSATIKHGLRTIEERAFANNELTSIVIPSSVETIGYGAFQANQLTNVAIEDGVRTIEDYAFAGNELTSIVIPSSVETISKGSFGSNQLTNVAIEDGVRTIEGYAFANNDLTSIVIPSSVETIGYGAFESNQLTGITIPDGVVAIGAEAFARNPLTSIEIPGSVATIGGSTFEDIQLTSAVIRNGVSKIEGYAFADHKLTSIAIPSSVDTIGFRAFYGNQLTSVAIEDGVRTIEGYAFANNELTSIVIPSSVETIDSGLFQDNQLTTVAIEGGVRTIGEYAFANNELTSIVIPSSVETIGYGAFFNNQLTTVAIEDGVRTIESSAFVKNEISSIVIPDSVTTIGETSFILNELQRVEIPEYTEVHSRAFDSNVEIIRRPMGSPIDIQVTSLSFNEGLPSRSVVGALTARDSDADDAHTYALVSGDGDTDNNRFIIDSDQLIILESPDYEVQDSYSIRIRTVDSRGLTFERFLELEVNDINMPPEGLLLSKTEFNEGIARQSIVASLNSHDPDSNDYFSYSLINGEGDVDNDLFTIDGDQLRILVSPNYEEKDSYTIRLRTTDAGGLSLDKVFELYVNDLGEVIQHFITSNSVPIRYKGGEQIVMPIAYSTIDGTSDQPLSFNVHFDSSLFAFAPSSGVIGELSENLLQLGALKNDALDLDGDTSTDRYIPITITALPENIPSNSDPVKLADLIFTAADLPIDPVTGLRETTINFSQTESVPGHTFASTSALLQPIPFSLDVDQDGEVTALGDGLMIIRHLFGPAFAGDRLINKAISPDSVLLGGIPLAQMTTEERQSVSSMVAQNIQVGIDSAALDVDQDGDITALGDGLMVIRHLFGPAFAGDALINKAISPDSVLLGEIPYEQITAEERLRVASLVAAKIDAFF